MGTFVVLLRNKDKGHLTEELLQRHITYLQQLDQDGKLVLCGPFASNADAIQILRAPTIEEATAWIEADPFIAEQYYQSYELNEMIEANASNHWLVKDSQTHTNLGGS